MKKIFLTFAMLVTSCAAKAQETPSNHSSISSFFEQYISNYNKFFETGDEAAIEKAVTNYNDPVILFDAPVAVLDNKNVLSALRRNLGSYRESGVREMRWLAINSCMLSQSAAFSRNTVTQLYPDGSVHDTYSVAFMLSLAPEGWRISGFTVLNSATDVNFMCSLNKQTTQSKVGAS